MSRNKVTPEDQAMAAKEHIKEDYTNRKFHNKLKNAGMTQSMFRVGKCIDNDPMEGFCGILKRERYHGRRSTSREELVEMIENYIITII